MAQRKGIDHTRHRVLNKYVKEYQQMLSLNKSDEDKNQQGVLSDQKGHSHKNIEQQEDKSVDAITKMPIDYN